MSGESVDIIKSILEDRDSHALVVGDLWVQWDTLRSSWKEKVKEVTQYVFADSTRDTSNGKNFEHSTHRPKICQIYDTLTASYFAGLIPNKNWLRLETESKKDTEDLKKRKAIMAYLLTKHRISKFSSVIEDLIDDWAIYGNAFAMVYYSQERTNPDNKNNKSGMNYVGPKVRRVSPYDIVFNPTASSWERTPKIIRSVMSLAELIRKSEDNPEDGYLVDGIQRLQEHRRAYASQTAGDINKAHNLAMAGFGSWGEYVKSDTVEVLELYGDLYDKESGTLLRDYVITVADRGIVLRKMPMETWSGRPHIHKTGWRNRKDNLWSQGPLENLCGLQYKLNHLENAKADAFDEMIYGDLVISGSVDVSKGEHGNKTYTLPEGGSVSRLAPDTTILSANFEISGIETSMEIYAGVPREAAGFRSPGEKTKFEVAQLLSKSGVIFQHKLTKFEVELLEPIVNSELQVARDNLVSKDVVRFDDQEGLKEFITLTKEDLFINGNVVPMGARHFARQAQLATDLRDFQTYVLATDKELQQHFPALKLATMWESILGFDEFDIVEAYGRVPEQIELARRTQAATKQLQLEDQVGDQLPEEL